MTLDHNSLMLAISLSGVALATTMLITWMSSRTEPFLLTWAVGMGVLVSGASTFGAFSETGNLMLLPLSMALLVIGFSIVYGAALQFTAATHALLKALFSALLGLIAVLAPFALGFNGLGLIMGNIISATMLALIARQKWNSRSEAPAAIAVLALLYVITAISFLACAIVAIQETPLHLTTAPNNWAENLNAIASIVGITGIGAVSLALNQSRLARRHRKDALTDPLTGLLNRRAIFDHHGTAAIASHTAVILFDLDRFKAVNDLHGHGIGDEVLRRFTRAVSEYLRPIDMAARMGGEEFIVVMPRSTPDLAVMVAERIRATFATDIVDTALGPLSCTVSAGVAFAEDDTFDTLISKADSELYAAKRAGRNQVSPPSLRLVA